MEYLHRKSRRRMILKLTWKQVQRPARTCKDDSSILYFPRAIYDILIDIDRVRCGDVHPMLSETCDILAHLPSNVPCTWSGERRA